MSRIVLWAALAGGVSYVAGWFLDWYDITGVKNSEGKTSIQFDINRGKIREDLKKGTQKFNETVENLHDDKSNTPQGPQPPQPPTEISARRSGCFCLSS